MVKLIEQNSFGWPEGNQEKIRKVHLKREIPCTQSESKLGLLIK